MVRRAAAFIVGYGPATEQDRWEEDAGFSPFTLAVVIAALLCAADIAELQGDPHAARYLRETADIWNASIERWSWAEGSTLARNIGVSGFNVRIGSSADGEHPDGSPFEGIGRGRGWPLLAGERAHDELAAGNLAEVERLAAVMRAQASAGGLLPEQAWDAADIPELEPFNGHPCGSAMPLVRAHAEYVKLMRSLRDGDVFDCPPQRRCAAPSTDGRRSSSWTQSIQDPACITPTCRRRRSVLVMRSTSRSAGRRMRAGSAATIAWRWHMTRGRRSKRRLVFPEQSIASASCHGRHR